MEGGEQPGMGGGFGGFAFHISPTAAADGWRAGCLQVGAVRAALAFFSVPTEREGRGQQSMPFALNRGKIIFQKYI
jgi:hypothetical protein